MIFELLSAESNIALDLIDKTSKTADVQAIVQLSLAPAFLLAGIGALMNVMMARLIWIAGRIERLEDKGRDNRDNMEERECVRLKQRRQLTQRAVKFSTAAALLICVVIALLFASALTEAPIGILIAAIWIGAMLCLIAGLILFLLETLSATKGQTLAAETDEGS